MAVITPETLVPDTGVVFWTRFPARALPRTNWSDHIDAHKTVMRLFPVRLDGPADERRKHANILFRIDILNGEPVVMVQSSVPPEMLPADARTMQVSNAAWAVEAGATVRFRAAVRAIKRNGRAKTEMIVPAAEADEWFAARLGYSVTGLDILNHARDEYRRSQKGANHEPALMVVDLFDCVARVANVDAFNRLRLEGVGRSKAYGAGLLTAQRIG